MIEVCYNFTSISEHMIFIHPKHLYDALAVGKAKSLFSVLAAKKSAIYKLE